MTQPVPVGFYPAKKIRVTAAVEAAVFGGSTKAMFLAYNNMTNKIMDQETLAGEGFILSKENVAGLSSRRNIKGQVIVASSLKSIGVASIMIETLPNLTVQPAHESSSQ